VHELTFQGTWDIPGPNRLVYRLTGSSTDVLEFSVSLKSRAVQPRKGQLVYVVGVVGRHGVRQHTLTFFGTWKVNRDLSVSFEIPYADGRVEAMRFKATAVLGARDQIDLALSSAQGDALGLTITWSRALVPDTTLFLRLRKSATEHAALGGIQVRF
jgi:hypothetical protein